MGNVVEFRGCDHLVVARVLSDDATGITYGAVTTLAPVATISKTVETSSETHYYDNTGALTIRSEGTDTITLTVPALPLDKLAMVTGKGYDSATGAYIDSEAQEIYYALGYRIKKTDGSYRYVWRAKGSFTTIPNEESNTESDSVDTNNQELTFTGIKTIYEFENGGRSKGVVCDESDGLVDFTHWWDTVVTPDTVGTFDTSHVTGVVVSPATATLQVGATRGMTVNVSVESDQPAYTGKIVYDTTDDTVASVNANGLITAVGVGTAVVTAKVGRYAGGTIVTVTAGA